MTASTKSNLFAAGTLLAFLAFKLSQLSFRFGDGNAYIYMADRLLHGVLPYRDFFLADPPLLVYILALVKSLAGGHLMVFQAAPAVFEAATAGFIYLILRNRQFSLPWLGPLVYLFSFTVIATSDFLTGIQATVFFLALGFWLAESRRDFWAGAAFALACLVKLYAFPAVLGVYLYWGYQQDWARLKKMAAGSLASGVLVLLPFLLLSPRAFWDSVVIHQLNRPGGNSKTVVWEFFLKKEWLILAFGLLGLAVRKTYPYLLAFLFSAVFLFWFKDLYYVYFQTLVFFAAFGVVWFIGWWQDNPETRPLAGIALLALVVSQMFGLVNYQANHAPLGRLANARELAAYARTLDQPLYGSHEVAPLIALLAGKNLFHNYIDTNSQAFASEGQNLKQASEEAVSEGVYLIARITDRPDLGIKPTGYEGYFDSEQFRHCRVEKEFASPSREADNKIIFYFCKRN